MSEYRNCVLTRALNLGKNEDFLTNEDYEACETHETESKCRFNHEHYNILHDRLGKHSFYLCPPGHMGRDQWGTRDVMDGGQFKCKINQDLMNEVFGGLGICGDTYCDPPHLPHLEGRHCFVEEHNPDICGSHEDQDTCLGVKYPLVGVSGLLSQHDPDISLHSVTRLDFSEEPSDDDPWFGSICRWEE